MFPYELLFSTTDTVKTVGITISYNLIQTYCYIYVKPENKSDTSYDMTFASNMIYVDTGIMHRSLKNGKSNITYQSKTDTVYSTAYANGSYAVDNYKNATAHGDSFVYGYQYRNPRGTEKLSISYGIYNAPGFITK